MEKQKILIVDDEADIREILEFNLQNEGFDVDTASSAEEALKILSWKHQLILLDVMMAGISGFRLAEKLRRENNRIPIIFLTAKDTENDMLTGFSAGGDDYISKPFSIKEVIARIKAVLKRMEPKERIETELFTSVEGLKINLNLKQIFVNENLVELTRKEFEILCFLVRNPMHVYTREKILEMIWKDDGYVLERTVDVHITRLRKKMGVFGNCIVNRSGYGYCFEPEKIKNNQL